MEKDRFSNNFLGSEKMKYPAFKEGPEVEDFHGTKVPDPFKWLEEPDAEDTKDFVNKQNEIFGKNKIIDLKA